MQRREAIAAIVSTLAAWPVAAYAQQDQLRRVLGVLMPFEPHDTFGQQVMAALRQGLEQHGWFEGQNLHLIVRWIGGDEERRRRYAAELAGVAPDVIFACFAAQLAAIARETKQIPLVFVGVTDPVGSGHVATIARPGGNITGFTFFEQSLAGKWLELLSELVPALTRAAVIVNPDTALGSKFYLAQFRAVAEASRVEPVVLLVRRPDDIESAIGEFAAKPHSGLIVLPDTFTTDHRETIVAIAQRYRLPTVFQFTEAVRIGGLASYGPDQIDVIRRSAGYVNRIFRGEKPAELPVQAPTKYELALNLKTAKELGLSVPVLLQQRADEVIE